jgi:hypothetical protein
MSQIFLTLGLIRAMSREEAHLSGSVLKRLRGLSLVIKENTSMKCMRRPLAFVVIFLSLAGPALAGNGNCNGRGNEEKCPPASVPEIDVGAGVSAVALLLGGGALLGERFRHRTTRPVD